MDQRGGVLTARALLQQEHSPIPPFFVQSVFASFLKSMLKCISKDNFRRLPWLLLPLRGYVDTLVALPSEEVKGQKSTE